MDEPVIHEITVVSTPTRTPVPSPLVSNNNMLNIGTPDRTIADLDEQSINDSIKSEVVFPDISKLYLFG